MRWPAIPTASMAWSRSPARIISPDTLDRARGLGLDAMASLENNDAHSFFEKLGDQVVTGPTQTNVNDFRAILIGG